MAHFHFQAGDRLADFAEIAGDGFADLGGRLADWLDELMTILRPSRAMSSAADAWLPESVDAMPESEPTRGPGWFDSSWDLLRGLEVREGLPGDARLHEWLAVCLAGEVPRQPAPVASSGRAERDEQPGPRLLPATAHRAVGDALQLGDLGLAVAAEVAHLDQFSQFGIDRLELV